VNTDEISLYKVRSPPGFLGENVSRLFACVLWRRGLLCASKGSSPTHANVTRLKKGREVGRSGTFLGGAQGETSEGWRKRNGEKKQPNVYSGPLRITRKRGSSEITSKKSFPRGRIGDTFSVKNQDDQSSWTFVPGKGLLPKCTDNELRHGKQRKKTLHNCDRK